MARRRARTPHGTATTGRRALRLATITTVAVLLAGCSDHGNEGRYVAVDGTGPPHAVEQGWMAALPADVAPDLLGRPQNDAWHYHVVGLDEAEVTGAGGAWEPLDGEGRFTLPLTPGTWVVCAVGDGRGATEPRTVGCSQITLADGDRLLATIGERGFHVTYDR